VKDGELAKVQSELEDVKAMKDELKKTQIELELKWREFKEARAEASSLKREVEAARTKIDSLQAESDKRRTEVAFQMLNA
jgi:SMC interacting uncharacterized protein involved in chromosome segregation